MHAHAHMQVGGRSCGLHAQKPGRSPEESSMAACCGTHATAVQESQKIVCAGHARAVLGAQEPWMPHGLYGGHMAV